MLCFVGRLPTRRSTRYLRKVIREELAEHAFLGWRFADDFSPGPEAFEQLRSAIDRAIFCIFEVSGVTRGDAFLEVGYALGQGRYCVLLHRRGDRCLAHFAARQLVQYSSAKTLSAALRQVEIFPQVLSAFGDGARNDDLLIAVGGGLLEQRLFEPSDIFAVAADHGCSEQQVLHTVDSLRALGMAERQGVDWRVTERGRASLPRLIAEIRGASSRTSSVNI